MLYAGLLSVQGRVAAGGRAPEAVNPASGTSSIQTT